MDDARCREMVELVRRTRHDANSPITAALGHVQLLLDEPESLDPEIRESLEVVEEQLKRLSSMIQRLKAVKYEEA